MLYLINRVRIKRGDSIIADASRELEAQESKVHQNVPFHLELGLLDKNPYFFLQGLNSMYLLFCKF
jgi:hypothetical protein